jgi:hypothetical protein
MAQTTSEEWDSRWSATRRSIDKEVIDAFFEEYPTIADFRKRGSKVDDSGGTEFQCILQSAGGTATAFDRYDELPKNPVDPFESAFYKRRYYAVPVILSDTEDWENAGPQKVFDQLEALGNNALTSLLKAINEDIYSAQAGKNILGFQDHMADATGATVGGIDSSASTFWESQRYTSAKTFTTQSLTNVYDGYVAWNTLMDDIRIQGGMVKKMFTTFSIVQAYRTVVASTGYARTDLANAAGVGGDHAPPFYGVPVIADNDCAALHTYQICDNIKMQVLGKANFRKTPFTSLQPNGQLAQLAYFVAGVQLTNNNRRRGGVCTALTGN